MNAPEKIIYTPQDTEKCAQVQRWLEQHQQNRAWLSRKTKMPNGTLSQILNGKYTASPTRQLDLMLSVIEVEAARLADGTPGYVKGSVHKLVNVVCSRTRKERSFGVVTGFVGTGKTRTLKEYRGTHPQTLLVEASPSMTPGNLLSEILRQLNVPEPAGLDKKFRAIVDALSGTNFLIICDEADRMSSSALEYVRRIRDMALIGIVLAGTEKLRQQLNVEHGNFDQIRSRVGMWPPTIKSIHRDDADDMVRAALAEAGDLSDEVLDTLWAYCKGSARVLMEGLVPAVRDYGLKQLPLTSKHIEAIASKVLFMERPVEERARPAQREVSAGPSL